MKKKKIFTCRKYSNDGELLSLVTLDTRIDTVEGLPIENVFQAVNYCMTYLTPSNNDDDKSIYWICGREDD